MKAYRVRGEFLMGRQYQPFTQEVAAEDGNMAVEKVLSLLGSKHRTKRKFIRVEQVDELALEEVTDPSVSQVLQVG